MSGAGLVDFLLYHSQDARQTAVQHPWIVPCYLVAAFAVGWIAPYVWDAAVRHASTTVKLVGVALGGLAIVALAPAISSSSVAGPPCALTQGCASHQQAHEQCSQRYDDWQKWQRCVVRRTAG